MIHVNLININCDTLKICLHNYKNRIVKIITLNYNYVQVYTQKYLKILTKLLLL